MNEQALTPEEESMARDVLKQAEPAKPRPLRDRILSTSTKVQTSLYVDPEVGPMVFKAPGFKTGLELHNKKNELDRLVFMLMHCLFEPVLGPAPGYEPQMDEDGNPRAGKPAFEKADEEWIRETDHPTDGWFTRTLQALGEFVSDTAGSADVGKR